MRCSQILLNGPPKARGYNLLKRKQGNVHPRDLIKKHSIFEGDTVRVVGGRLDVGKEGKVIAVVKDKNLVVIKDVAMQIKHIKPNPFYPKGDKILKETPLHYSNVQLVEGSTGQPVRVVLKEEWDPVVKRMVLMRISRDTGIPIPLPPKKDPFAGQKEGPNDTKPDTVAAVTFTPLLNRAPFPNSLMNEMERMERKKGAARGL